MKEPKEDKFEKLRWLRLISPDVIPKYLVDQVKNREFEIEDFYKFQQMNCLLPSEKGITVNPLNHLYSLVNDENIVMGFLWFTVDPLCKNIFINTYSVDNELWGGKAVGMAADHVKKIMKEANITKAFWITRYPRHSERHGFKKAREAIMEYKEEFDG